MNSTTLAAGAGQGGKVTAPVARSNFRLYPCGGVQFVDARVVSPISFAHITDLHLTPETTSDSEQPYRAAIEWWDHAMNRPHRIIPKLLSEIREANVDFVLFGGDNLDCYQPHTANRLVDLVHEFGLVAFFQSGNHDWENMHIRYVTHSFDALLRNETLQKLCRHWNMPAPYYSFEMKGVRFIVLDTPYMKMDVGWAGKFDDRQTEWILSELKYDGPIVIFHHIPFNRPTLEHRLRLVWGGFLACVAEDYNGLRVLQAIEECPNLLGTFTGHAHIRSEDVLGGSCQFMTAPASDSQWRLVRIGNSSPPKSLHVGGVPQVYLPV